MITPKLKPCAGESCNGQLRHIWKAEGKLKYCKDCWFQMNPQKKLKVNVPIKPISDKMRKNMSQYEKLATAFKAMHPYCQAKLPGCNGKTTDVHHKAGRGENLTKVSTYLAVCRYCHHWIEEHPEASKELGFSESRLETNEKSNTTK